MAKKANPSNQGNGKANPKSAAGGETVSGYFRKIFEDNPKLLDSRSNEELLNRWLADHPGQTKVPDNIKSNLSNLKSVLRSKGRKKTAARAAKAEVATPLANKPAPRPTPPKTQLEKLEEQIDDCLTFARTLDREGLDEVILHLRKARNTVVWKMGQ